MFRPIIPHQGLLESGGRRPHARVHQPGELHRVAFPLEDRSDDRQPTEPRHVAEHLRQRQVHLVQRLLHVLALGRAGTDQFVSIPQIGAHHTIRIGGPKRTLQESIRVQALTDDFVGTPEKLAVSLYPPGSTLPLSGSPNYILNMDIPLGDYTFGEVIEYRNADINLLGVDYGDYAMAVNIYVAGGNYPIPTSGKDYMSLQDITINSNTIAVETPFEFEVLVY